MTVKEAIENAQMCWMDYRGEKVRFAINGKEVTFSNYPHMVTLFNYLKASGWNGGGSTYQIVCLWK